MLLKASSKYLTLLLTLLFSCSVNADNQCAARAIKGQSVVCVCNATYCDDVQRELPEIGRYVAYTTSKGGLRFHKTKGQFESIDNCCSTVLTLDVNTTYQSIEGFGGAVTDSAGINWKNLSEPLQKHLISSYFADNGIQYNMLRVPIGGCDFSTHAYAYNMLPENDTQLSNYSLAYEDFHYKIPMIKAIKAASSAEIDIVASTWSPPSWMKTNHAFYGYSHIKPEYMQTYADYHHKFLQKYQEQGIKVWGITTTNEPLNGETRMRFNSLGWKIRDMGLWIANNLGPTIRNSTFTDVKILAVDDQRFTIPFWFNRVVEDTPKALDFIDGVAVHAYWDFIAPASLISNVPKYYPKKFVLVTEDCAGNFPWQTEKVLLGSWDRAAHFIWDIIENLNHNVIGWIDWNLCLNAQGGPNWVNNFVDSPIIVFPENNEILKQPMFYAMGHFSKFIPKNSKRINVNEKKPILKKSIDNVAFVTPNNTIVLVLHNSGSTRTVVIRLRNKQVKINLEAHSVTTLEFLQ